MPETGFDGCLVNLKRLLAHLGDKPKRRKEINRIAQGDLGLSYDQFDFLFALTLKRNYIKKLERGIYQRTETGKALVELL
jgi:hypothetical protein